MNSVHCETDRAGEYSHRITTRGHTVHGDVSEASGGHDAAPGAHDYFDIALAACRVATAMWFAKRNGIPLERAESDVERDDSEERAGRYKLKVRVAFHGPLTEEQRDRLYAAVNKCPIHKLMTTTEVVIETAPLEGTR
jgi:putative redox protein